MQDELEQEEPFSENPEEQLKFENEILKLKLQAELGADFTGEEELSPDLENIFLKNVLEFEHQYANADTKSIYDILGRPEVLNEADLNDDEVEESLAALEALLENKGIVVDYNDDYTNRTKYRFVTEELFLKESMVIDIPGMTTHFIYEDFYPNHSFQIKEVAEKFFHHWFERSREEDCFDLADEIVLQNGTKLSRDVVFQKMKWIFDAYVVFENITYTIENAVIDSVKPDGGNGYVEGIVSYDAVLENGEKEYFSGPYKLDMRYTGLWNIINFDWPGFRWS